MTAPADDAFSLGVAHERERCAKLLDREAFYRLLVANEYPRLERAFGDVSDNALVYAYATGNTDAFLSRAIEIDTTEARDVRASIDTPGRLARWIRSGLSECPRPSWRS